MKMAFNFGNNRPTTSTLTTSPKKTTKWQWHKGDTSAQKWRANRKTPNTNFVNVKMNDQTKFRRRFWATFLLGHCVRFRIDADESRWKRRMTTVCHRCFWWLCQGSQNRNTNTNTYTSTHTQFATRLSINYVKEQSSPFSQSFFKLVFSLFPFGRRHRCGFLVCLLSATLDADIFSMKRHKTHKMETSKLHNKKKTRNERTPNRRQRWQPRQWKTKEEKNVLPSFSSM